LIVSDLSYSVDVLQGLGGDLKNLSTDFKDGEGSANYGTSDVGHVRVADALDNFRTNWNDNRDHLAEKLATLGDLASKAAEGFSEADADLATKLREKMEEGS
jgi:hypothetical protein